MAEGTTQGPAETTARATTALRLHRFLLARDRTASSRQLSYRMLGAARHGPAEATDLAVLVLNSSPSPTPRIGSSSPSGSSTRPTPSTRHRGPVVTARPMCPAPGTPHVEPRRTSRRQLARCLRSGPAAVPSATGPRIAMSLMTGARAGQRWGLRRAHTRRVPSRVRVLAPRWTVRSRTASPRFATTRGGYRHRCG